jgi:hypothetical protein
LDVFSSDDDDDDDASAGEFPSQEGHHAGVENENDINPEQRFRREMKSFGK